MIYQMCDVTSIQNNSMKVFQLKLKSSVIDVLIGKINGKLFACNNYCPHRGASLSKSDLSPSNNRIICYLHDFEYNLTTGKLEKIPIKWSRMVGPGQGLCRPTLSRPPLPISSR